MKTTTLKITVSLTIISFACFTKWWFVLPVDAPDTFMYGFPFIWVSNGWHTSMSNNIFVVPLLLDLLIFYLIWHAVIYCSKRLIGSLKVPKFIIKTTYLVTLLICFVSIWIAVMPEHKYYWQRDFEIEVQTTGYKFIWEDIERPLYRDHKKQSY